MPVQGGLLKEDATQGATVKVVLYATTAAGALKPVLCDTDGKIITTT